MNVTHARRFSAAVVFLSSVVMATAACTSTTSGQPSTPTSAEISAATSTAATDNGAPKVTSPKNLKAITDPCQLLTPQQLQELGASGPRPDKSKWGEASCTWRNDNLNLNVAPDTTQGQGMAAVYAHRKDFSNSEKTSVNGHPGLRVEKFSKTCGLYVGTSDTQLLLVDVAVLRDVKPEYRDHCAFIEKVAGMVLSNLPPAS
ncbi:DUF3558 domain-containing protein [Streptoalloteichus tenebrarius]|nr:DUF3558 domain-containing protein [Streptoalloteichus tenebrarius]BFF01351.1 hypothetical protein GCM10020241_30260 [Streptoalloteichus tenebrarius]